MKRTRIISKSSQVWQRRPRGRLLGAVDRLGQQLGGHAALLESINHRAGLLEDINHVLATSAERTAPRDAPRLVRQHEIRLPRPSNPDVTVVIPVHGQRRLTFNCLAALAADDEEVAFDVLAVDDASPGTLGEELEAVHGLRVLRLASNRGFLHACNAGVDATSAPFVALLNNDTEVHAGWLDALVARARSDDTIAIVGGMLVFPSGVLQDAGGIIFSDGEGWNYGRHANPDDFAYGWPRDVDYCSGAALLVRRSFWDEVGGFDPRFAPAYYEDTDLAFSARERGRRVVYEPRARVTHVEGGSHGRDLASGIKAYQAANRVRFAEKWTARLGHQFPNRPGHLLRARDVRRGGHVLVADHIVPEPDRDSGSLRMRMLLELLVEEGFVVHFVADNLVGTQPYTSELQRLGIEVVFGPIDPFAVMKELAADISLIILSRPGVAWRYIPWAREHCPRARIVFDMVDAHGLRERRRAAVTARDGVARAADALDHMETALARSADLTLAVSSSDAEHVRRLAGDVPVEVLSNIYRPRSPAPGVEGRDGVLFVGSFAHNPNVRAAADLVRTVVPNVAPRVGGAVRTTIVGQDPPRSVRQLASPSVVVTGWVRDLEPLQHASRVFVAPLTFGAGVKGKVCDSLLAGLPVVTTSIGAEGLDLVHGEHVLISDDVDGLAELVVRVLTDDVLWKTLSTQGRARAEELVGLDAGRRQLREILEVLDVAAPPSRRRAQSAASNGRR